MARFEDVLSTLLDVVKTVFPEDGEQQLKLAAVRKAYADIGIPRPASARR
jgi:hypothetical protein